MRTPSEFTVPKDRRASDSLVSVLGLSRTFDVSPPFLNRLIERLPKRTLKAVTDVSFNVERGTVFALVGESGSGKTTIGRMVVGLMEPSAGNVLIDGERSGPDSRRGGVQMVFQDPYASLNPRWRVRDIIAEPVVAQGGKATGIAEQLLEKVGLSADDAKLFPHQFSGGQRQRIGIARALASNPKLIVCDEPTSALDVSVQAQVLNLMSDLKDEFGLTYIFISHDLTVVRHMADRIGVLYLGRLVEEAPVEELFTDAKHPYTRMLLEAAPRMDAFGREASIPIGEIPDPISPPPGCAFHPRCPLATEVCRRSVPAMQPVNKGRVACHHAL
ncbi:ABC transporter ATP-binding protein [Microvirga pudoricolor]|uniref:ABC transporter ATP-binding protein n=1 Tax=Microvirga pudoricolor TaxID=2778729 RepID=UPI00194E1D3B|nr:oligopeptide/dipeptide ABC transporter ATP-binding protein [Microvirga pudoricolor]MBM6596659.1 ATP-binding cassette domain-containing protein [Microvirga pudoricolor]